MMLRVFRFFFLAASLVFLSSTRNLAQTKSAGVFEASGDVGTVRHAGSVQVDSAKGTYTLAASGENVWFDHDAFQFAWKKISGDISLSADIEFLGTGGNPHRKALLMIRQSLDAGSVYADIARHGNGMTALQFRTESGGLTTEVQSPNWNPRHLRIEKHGAYFTMWLASDGDELKPAAASPRIELQEPFYVGIGLSSHDQDVVEKAVFSNVALSAHPAPSATDEKTSRLISFLEWVPIDSGDRTAIYVAQGRFEAPNWTPDGKAFLFNRDGKIVRLSVDGGSPQALETGFADHCNNDHGISPDGALLAISDQSQDDHQSTVYTIPIGGRHPPPHHQTLAFVLAWVVS